MMAEGFDDLDQELVMPNFQTVISQTNVVLAMCFPILKILRILCVLPYHIKDDGRIWFSLYSSASLATCSGYIYLMTLYCSLLNNKWNEFDSMPKEDIDKHCYYAVGLVLLIPTIFIPVIYWTRILTICEYWNNWLGFQILYKDITGIDLQIDGRNRAYIGTFLITAIHASFFLIMITALDIAVSTAVVYIHMFAVINYSIFCWHLMCYSTKLVANEIRKNFGQKLNERPTNVNRIKHYQPLWTCLHIMMKNLSATFDLPLKLYRMAVSILSLIILLSIALDLTVENSFNIGLFLITVTLLVWSQLILRALTDTLQEMIHEGHNGFVDEMRLVDNSLLTEDENQMKSWLTQLFPLMRIEFISFNRIFVCACFSSVIAVLIINTCEHYYAKRFNETFTIIDNSTLTS